MLVTASLIPRLRREPGNETGTYCTIVLTSCLKRAGRGICSPQNSHGPIATSSWEAINPGELWALSACCCISELKSGFFVQVGCVGEKKENVWRKDWYHGAVVGLYLVSIDPRGREAHTTELTRDLRVWEKEEEWERGKREKWVNHPVSL